MIRLDPRYLFLWRSPTSCQFGSIKPEVVLDTVTPNDERVLSVLKIGVPRETLRALARQWTMSQHDLDDLLGRLTPVLATAEGDTGERHGHRIEISGSGPGRGEIRYVLDVGSGDVEAGEAGLCVLVESYFVQPCVAGPLLRRDVPHLLVVFDEQGATIGPLVQPGLSACAHCIDLERRDLDPAWIALASQLQFAQHPETTATLRCRVALEVAKFVEMPSDWSSTTRHRVDRVSGVVTAEGVSVHPACQCQGLQETETVCETNRAVPLHETTSR